MTVRGAMCGVLVGVLVTGLLAVRPLPAYADVILETNTDVATAGYYRLSWEKSDTPSRLVESTDSDFIQYRVIYSGPDTARLISGKPDGDYYYRLEAVDGSHMGRARLLSNELKVTVEHHSLERALFFFALGAVVFAATLGLIVFGNRAETSAP